MTNAVKNYAAAETALKTHTPQTQRTPGRTDEVQNNAGGFVFATSDKSRLERFLILGTDGGTYYQSEKTITKQNVDFVNKLIKDNYRLVVDTLLEVNSANRAAKNSPSLYVLALLVAATDGDKVYLRASGVFDAVVRTSTHLFEFANYVDGLGGWGRAKRDLIAGWYTGKETDKLAYQVVKYRQREGWTHRDLFRKVHPKGVDTNVGRFILGQDVIDSIETNEVKVIEGFKAMQRATSAKEVIAVLNEYKNLPWETIPTQFLKDPQVWKTLFYNGAVGQTALIRNVTRFAKIGAFDDIVFAGDVAKALADRELIVKGRVHPVAYANAMGVYDKGAFQYGDRSGYGYGGYGRQKDWTTNAKVAAGLEAGFYESFHAVEPANKPTMVSLDVSGSMSQGAGAGLVGLTCAEAAGLMAMVVVRTEPYVVVNGFQSQLVDLGISATDSFATVTRKISNRNFGATDASLPMVEALRKRQEIEFFTTWTDNETWSGRSKPHQALAEYRNKMGLDARSAVVGFTATEFSIADDSGNMMDFVGFDSTAPRIMSDFAAHRF